MKTIKLLILLMVATLSMQSCREDSDIINVNPPSNTDPIGMNIQSSVLGTVVDENGQAVSDAVVTYGNLTETTDQYGVFQFDNETMNTGGTYIEVEKDGYFKGSRKFYPTAESTSRVNVELMPMVSVSTFNSASGEKVKFEGVEISFGNNSIMREDGSAYEGNVNVFAKYLDPTLSSTLDQMPGDLTAINATDERVALTTFGMLAVELRDDSGNELQVKDGSMVDIVMPIPADVLGSAPATIPLWHFDEDMGTWVEEGEATLVNGEYIGQVSHFSFWNYDVPSNFIHLSGSIFNRGVPVEGVFVKITNTDNNTTGYGYTNNNGIFGGYVPNGAVLVIEVFDHCGTLIYTTTVGPYEEDVVLDPFNLTITSMQAIVSGEVTLCDGEPSAATYVVIIQDDLTFISSVEDDNTFQTNIFYCEEGAEIIVAAEDPINQLASGNSIFTVEGNIDVGLIQLCEESLSNYLYYQYGDQEFIYDETSQDSSVVMYTTYEMIIEAGQPDKYIYHITAIDWNFANEVIEFDLIYIEGAPEQYVTIPVPQGGFNASGTATIQRIEQGGDLYITSTGTFSDIEITDETKYDPSFNPLFFSTTTRIQ